MHALIVTNMYPTPARPALGSFVRDQVQALRRIEGIEIELFAFAPGGARAYANAGRDLARRHRRERYDIVHAHFGLSAWPALAARGAAHVVTLHGTDLVHPRSRAVTIAALPFHDLVATVSEPLASLLPPWARAHAAILPCGVDIERFAPRSRAEARAELGLDGAGTYVLFPADPRRPEKRHDRALAVVAQQAELLTLGNVDPQRVPLYVNAANAVLVPSERESFGLAVLEALACNVPVLATPVGIAPDALADVKGTLCAPFD
ncbi:MAG: glycosyltransferase, partial [Solirubrobacterales bacterium]|nr:glycosyltransferase [Solirubrobacterales bacterium]